MKGTIDLNHLDLIERLKKEAGETAIEYIESGMVVGLGTGSTTRYALEELGKRLKTGRLKGVLAVPSSRQTEKLARGFGIELTTLDDVQEIDITIDGADEVDPKLNLIKGGGGALLREKVLAQVSRRNIMIVDESKLSPHLGTHWPIPLEIIPFAWRPVEKFISTLGAKVRLRTKDDGTPYTTDQGNYILDSNFGPISDPHRLEEKLAYRAGIVESGLFLGTASEVIVAGKTGIRYLKREGM